LVDPEAVRRRLREIDRRIEALGAIRERGREAFLEDAALQTQAERHLQLAIQASIDVAAHVVAEDSAETPEDYGSTFMALAKMNVLGSDLAERLRLAAGTRNILVHAYLEVDPGRIWEHLSNLNDHAEFAAAIERYLPR
jgi:uncharacterized protein YutE (UPF0331/DUF86 family)